MEDAFVVGEVGVFPRVHKVSVSPVKGGGCGVMVFGEGAVVEAVGKMQMAGEVVGSSVIARTVPGGNELIAHVAGGGGIGVEVDHAFLGAPHQEGAFFTGPRLEGGWEIDLDSDSDHGGGIDGGEFNIGCTFEGPVCTEA